MSATTIPSGAMRHSPTRQMEQSDGRTFDAGPRLSARRSPIISSMQKTTPIRRYVLLRHRDHGVSASRWSMERIAAAPLNGASAPATVLVVDAQNARP